MTHLKKAHDELYQRSPDETFDSLESLTRHCQEEKEASTELWHAPEVLSPQVGGDEVQLHLGHDGAYAMNHWSFSQLCGLSGVSRETVNILSPETASQVLLETKPHGSKPLQLLTTQDRVRAIHGTQYSRLWNVDLLNAAKSAAPDFQPPQTAFNGGTGLYCGEQDLFAFLIDPAGWIEIEGEAFAPGFFIWNSEVGKRSLGVQTFWFQKVCQNHIVWDAVEVVDYQRRHTGNIRESLTEIQSIIERLVQKRDSRKDGFATVLQKVMKERMDDAEETTKFLSKHGINRSLITRAVKQIGDSGQEFTLWNLVDVLTQLTQEVSYAGARNEMDTKISQLLSLAV